MHEVGCGLGRFDGATLDLLVAYPDGLHLDQPGGGDHSPLAAADRPSAASARWLPVSPSAIQVPVAASEAATLIGSEPLTDGPVGPGATGCGGIEGLR